MAKALKVTQFHDREGRAVLDDHLALNDAGIPTIDIIDFEYPHWHTAKRPARTVLRGQPLAAVGKVVTAWLNKPKPRAR